MGRVGLALAVDEVQLLEVLVHEGNGHAALADGGCDALHRAVAAMRIDLTALAQLLDRLPRDGDEAMA